MILYLYDVVVVLHVLCEVLPKEDLLVSEVDFGSASQNLERRFAIFKIYCSASQPAVLGGGNARRGSFMDGETDRWMDGIRKSKIIVRKTDD